MAAAAGLDGISTDEPVTTTRPTWCITSDAVFQTAHKALGSKGLQGDHKGLQLVQAAHEEMGSKELQGPNRGNVHSLCTSLHLPGWPQWL